jgi:uncharacterized protein YjbI with pentapeptide repeats
MGSMMKMIPRSRVSQSNKGMNHRVAWAVAAVLAAVVVGGIGLLGVRLRPYWVARYRGINADMPGVQIPGASLDGVHLEGARLTGTNLRRANLRRAIPDGANLTNADLRGADMRNAILEGASLLADLRGADLGELGSTRRSWTKTSTGTGRERTFAVRTSGARTSPARSSEAPATTPTLAGPKASIP